MTSDDLQRYASLCRWIGLGVTFLGLIITFASHAIADLLITAQRTEKARSQERLQLTEAELERTKITVTDLQVAARPRTLPDDATAGIVAALSASRQSAPLVVTSKMMDSEARAFGEQIAAAITRSGWQPQFSPMAAVDFRGIRVVSSGDAEADAKVLQGALVRAKLEFSTEPVAIARCPIQLQPALYIFVGEK